MILVESRLVDTVGEGEGGKNWESGIGIYTLSCVKQIDSGKLLNNREPSLGICDDLERWDREKGDGARRYVNTYDWSTLWYGRNQHKIVKQFSTN